MGGWLIDKGEALSRELGRALVKLEELQRHRVRKQLEPRKQEVQFSEDERAAAITLLRDPNLLGRTLEDLERCGMVGEETGELSGRDFAAARIAAREPGAIEVAERHPRSAKIALVSGAVPEIGRRDESVHRIPGGKRSRWRGAIGSAWACCRRVSSTAAMPPRRSCRSG
jgi:hypothetical protein